MRIGISAYDLAVDELVELGRAADEHGFASLWLGEHVVAPTAWASAHPTQDGTATIGSRRVVDPDTILVDPLVALAAVGAVTSRLELATGIYLLALRHPLHAARAALSVEQVAPGRLRLGVGTGWLEEEFAALGVPFGERVARVEEAIGVLRRAWQGGRFGHAGRFYPFDELQVTPVAVSIPIVLGGNTEPALRRAVALADGWFSSGTPTFDEARRLRDRLSELAAAAGRVAPLATTWRMAGADPRQAEAYRSEGFDSLIVWADQVWSGPTRSARRSRLARVAAELGLVA